MKRNELIKKINKKGWRRIRGQQGSFGDVYKHPRKSYVIKVSFENKLFRDGWIAFAYYCFKKSKAKREYPNTLPKILKVRKLENDAYFALIEKLDKTVDDYRMTPRADYNFANMCNDMGKTKGAFFFKEVPVVNQKEFNRTLTELNKFAKNMLIHTDLHGSNIMYRGTKEIVVIDPFFEPIGLKGRQRIETMLFEMGINPYGDWNERH